MNIAETIKTARESLGMTQEDLAEKLEVSRQAVSKWELGASAPSPENLEILADVLGVVFSAETEPGAGEKAERLRPWKFAAIAFGVLLLSALLSIALYLVVKPRQAAGAEITGVYWFTEDGAALHPEQEDGWYAFSAGERVLLVVEFQDGREFKVFGVSVYLTPTGTETLDLREQIAVQAVQGGRNFGLFALDIPKDLMGHMEIVLECDGGQTVTEIRNVTSSHPALEAAP